MRRLDSTTALCAARSREFERLEAAAYRYAAEEGMDRPLRSELRPHARLLEKFPAAMENTLVGTVLMQRIFGSETGHRRFFSRTGYRAGDEAALAGMLAEPWRISVLTVHSRIEENFFKIKEAGDEKRERLLFSPGFERIEVNGRPLTICGISGDEICLQTFGPIIDLPAFDLADLHCFARSAAPDSYAQAGLPGVLAQNPIPFYLLSAFGSHRITMTGAKDLRYSASEFRLAPGLESEAEKLGLGRASKGRRALELGKSTDYDEFITLVLEPKKRKATLVAATPALYAKAARLPLLKGLAAEKPDYLAGMGMVIALESLLGKPFPGLQPGKSHGSDGDQKAENPELEALNAAFMEYSQGKNLGKAGSSPEDIAIRHGVDPASFSEMIKSIETKLEARFHIDLEGGIPGWTVPPPKILNDMQAELEQSSLFKLKPSAELEAELKARVKIDPGLLPKGIRALSLDRLSLILERSAKEFFGPQARTVLNFSLYLVLKFSPTPHAAKDFGTELLRAFWQVLIADRDEEQVDDFLAAYEEWFVSELFGFGLVEMAEKRRKSSACYRASPALKDWVSLA